jgi:hypothetical protein
LPFLFAAAFAAGGKDELFMPCPASAFLDSASSAYSPRAAWGPGFGRIAASEKEAPGLFVNPA